MMGGRRVHICGKRPRTPIVVDLQREARRIFADALAPARELDL